MSSKPRKRSLFDVFINWASIIILVYFVVNEFSHTYTTPVSIANNNALYQRHYNLTLRFPFIGSYFLMEPKDYDPRFKYPLVVILQGISKRVYAAEYLASENYRNRYKAFVLVPLPPQRAFWETPHDKAYALPQMIPYPDHMPQVMDMINDLQKAYNIDPDRIYVTGHSMGGAGVIGAMQSYPDVFAAGIAISGVWDPAETGNIKAPLWLFHGANDSQIQAKYSRSVASALHQQGKAVKYDELAGVGHDAWKIVYASNSAWDWLFSIKKAH